MKKVIHSQFLSFVSTRWGKTIIALGLFWCAHAAILLLHQAIQQDTNYSSIRLTDTPITASTIRHHQYSSSNRYTNNLAETSFEEQLSAPVIDVVYTWVNGSDEKLQRGNSRK